MATAEALEAMLARGQDSALLRYSLGGEYLKHGQHDKAITHLQKAVEQDPMHSAAWKRLGKALSEVHRRGEAIEAYTRGIRVAEAKGDKQAAMEMQVFLKRLQK